MASNGLWHQAPFYSAAGLFTVGFFSAIPSFAAVKSGAARLAPLAHNDAALVLYGHAFYTKASDLIDLKVTGPEGISFEHTTQIEKTQSQLFPAFGKRRPQTGWPSGNYRGTATLWRNNRILAVRQTELVVSN